MKNLPKLGDFFFLESSEEVQYIYSTTIRPTMGITTECRIVLTPDDRIAGRAIFPFLARERSDHHVFGRSTTSIDIFHHSFRRTSTCRRVELIIRILVDECCWGSRCTWCRPASSTYYPYTTDHISSHAGELRGEPGTEGVCDDEYFRSLYAVVISDISDDRIEKCDILRGTP
jgi:hypothetical protein